MARASENEQTARRNRGERATPLPNRHAERKRAERTSKSIDSPDRAHSQRLALLSGARQHELFPIETRVLWPSRFFYAFGAALGGVSGPLIFGALIASGSTTALFAVYVLGAVRSMGPRGGQP